MTSLYLFSALLRYVRLLGALLTLYSTRHTPQLVFEIAAETPPPTVDWRNEGKTTSVKNQGNCESCWAFSVAAGIESAVMIHQGLTNPLNDTQDHMRDEDGNLQLFLSKEEEARKEANGNEHDGKIVFQFGSLSTQVRLREEIERERNSLRLPIAHNTQIAFFLSSVPLSYTANHQLHQDGRCRWKQCSRISWMQWRKLYPCLQQPHYSGMSVTSPTSLCVANFPMIFYH